VRELARILFGAKFRGPRTVYVCGRMLVDINSPHLVTLLFLLIAILAFLLALVGPWIYSKVIIIIFCSCAN